MKAESIIKLSSQLPKSVSAARSMIGQQNTGVVKFACCPSCSQLYQYDDCNKFQQCLYVEFPDHPQRWHRKKCGTQLSKTVRTCAGKTVLRPRQVYCYRSVITSLTEFLSRSDFLDKCEQWRNRVTDPNILSDVYDGKIWQEFQVVEGKPFLAVPYNFALSLNVDWFQPFKHTQHSVGVIYFVVQNLPRKDRFKAENIIIIGVIPGPREPSLHINTFLHPLVNELKQLWQGVIIDCNSNHRVLVRAALICIACDIPAARKVCGFVGHSALHACSKCLKEFPTTRFGDKPDYSGCKRNTWPLRNGVMHRMNALKHKTAKTKTEQTSIERVHGLRYSVLLELPYLDIVRMCVIDPMHNLLLGTAKHMLSVWRDKNLVKPKHFEEIQAKVDKFHTPGDVGRIPTKIASGFSSFTAEQWKNWILLFSLFSLKDILPHSDFGCWHLFVKACSLICRRSVSLRDIQQADELLMEFLIVFNKLYGREHCNINLHLHAHLTTCLLDFGPAYSFWLFSFERMNGILGSFKTNSHTITIQLMNKLLSSHACSTLNWPADFRNEFSAILEPCVYDKGSLTDSSLSALMINGHIDPMCPMYEEAFDSSTRDAVTDVISASTSFGTFELNSLFDKCKAVKIGKHLLGSQHGRYSSSSIVKVCLTNVKSDEPVLAEIQYFARCGLSVFGNHSAAPQRESVWIACIKCFQEHQCKVWFGKPTELWGTDTNSEIFVCVTSLVCRVSYCRTSVDFGRVIGTQNVIVASPII